jgi:uncharacterized protein YecT (DUF1311 family)
MHNAGGILILVIAVALNLSALAIAAGGDWPKDYVVKENSVSPDGHYTVLVQSMDAASEQEDNESRVYLADVKSHTTLGNIDKVDYLEHQNHRALVLFWAPDSSYCVVENDGRYGVDTISILETKDSSFVQTEIDERIQKSLDGAMKKQAHKSEISGNVSPHFRLGTDRKVRVRALSQNNPKQFEDVKTYYALFQGTYDLAAKKWTVTDARSITADQSGVLEVGYQDPDFENTTYANDDDRAKSFDEEMNQVYQAAKFILPPARFAKVKQEQTEWLKKRDATSSIKARCELIEKRIRDFQDVLWQEINCRSSPAVSLARRVSVWIPEFFSSRAPASVTFVAALFRASQLQPYAVLLERFRSHQVFVPAQACGSSLANVNPGQSR